MIPPLALAALLGVTAKYYWQPQYESGDIPARFPGDVATSDTWTYFREPFYPCNGETSLYAVIGDDYTPPCGQSVPNANIDVVLVGDSHAAHLFPGLVELLPKKNIGYYTLGAIPPFDDGAEMKRIIDYIAQDPFIKTVIVNAYWSSYDVSERELLETLQKFRQNGKQMFVTDDIPFFFVPRIRVQIPD